MGICLDLRDTQVLAVKAPIRGADLRFVYDVDGIGLVSRVVRRLFVLRSLQRVSLRT